MNKAKSSSDWEEEFTDYKNGLNCCGGDYCDLDENGKSIKPGHDERVIAFIKTQISKAQEEFKEDLVKRIEDKLQGFHNGEDDGIEANAKVEMLNELLEEIKE